MVAYSKNLYGFFENLGFQTKNKSKTSVIPEDILVNETFIAAAIRGLFDTDGSVFFDKRSIFKEPYIRMDLHLNNTQLIQQTHNLLQKLGIRSTITKKRNKIQINGKMAIKTFMDKIGLSNSKHIIKIKKAPGESCTPDLQLTRFGRD